MIMNNEDGKNDYNDDRDDDNEFHERFDDDHDYDEKKDEADENDNDTLNNQMTKNSKGTYIHQFLKIM